MGDPLPSRLALPKLRYKIGSEPKKTVSINQHSLVAYITTVKDILRDDEFNRIRGTFLGPVIKIGERSLKLSAKIVHAVLTKSIDTVKTHEAWFHFGAQPMRFSIREFHMVTGLRCSGEVKEPREGPERFKWDFLQGRSHTVKDVERQLRNTREDASDERFLLAMLLLIESLLLQKSLDDGETAFGLGYVKIAQNIDDLMAYPWGRVAYDLLLKSLQRAVKKNLEKNSYDLQGFPIAFHLWILESVSLLQYQFSQVVPVLDVQPSTPVFLCEKYFQLSTPQLIDVLHIENKNHLKVTCILPPIPHDPEADVCIEDIDSKNLEDIADLSKRDYKFKVREWNNMSVDLYAANEEIRRASLLFGSGGMDQASSSYQDESLESKIDRIREMVVDNFRNLNARLCLIEKDSKEIKGRVTELEKLQGVASYETQNNETDTTPFSLHETVSRQVEADPDQADETLNNETGTTPLHETASRQDEASPDQADETLDNEDTREPMNEIISPHISDTQPLTRARRKILRKQKKAVESRVETSFEMGANVEIASQDDKTCHKWFLGIVLKTYLLDGVEMVKVEYSVPSLDKKNMTKRVRISVTIDRIRPQPPPEIPGETKSFELLDEVEAYENGVWCSGIVTCIFTDGTYFVTLNNSNENVHYNLPELRIPRKWVDGVWKLTEKKEEEQTQSVKPSIGDRVEKGKGKAVVCKKQRASGPSEDGVGKMAKEMEVQKAQSVMPSQEDRAKKTDTTPLHETASRQVEANPDQTDETLNNEMEVQQSVEPSQDKHAKKRKTPEVILRPDHLAFLRNRRIEPRSPPIPATPEVILPIDPFATPEFPRFSRLGHWMQLRGLYQVPFYVNGIQRGKEFFEEIDNPEKELRREHIDAAFAMLNSRRIEQATWFNDKGLPKACFLPARFLDTVANMYDSLKKPPKKGLQLLSGHVGNVVKGLTYPKKIWLEDVDVIYGLIEEFKSSHFIGMEIQLMTNIITLFHCGLPKSKFRVDLPRIQQLSVVIAAIKLELLGEKINFKDIVPFQVKEAEDLPKTRFRFNCGLFIAKMLECKSLGLNNMSNINDDNAMDLRSKLCCEIFDQFIDKDFQEGCRR